MLAKIADTEDELEQIHKLNYLTFVEEIPQHHSNTERSLIDKFHDKNTYIIVKEGDHVRAMLAFNSDRPFSLDKKISYLDIFLPNFNKILEVRLLAIKTEFRQTRVFYMLMEKLMRYIQENEIDIVLISGTVRQINLYHNIGFKDFAGLVGTEDARYQPMYITKEMVKRNILKKWLN